MLFQDGLVPAHLAAHNGHTESLAALIAAGAIVNLANTVWFFITFLCTGSNYVLT